MFLKWVLGFANFKFANLVEANFRNAKRLWQADLFHAACWKAILPDGKIEMNPYHL
ncbi:pentapeptide repeat-containing protein [Baaleninema simplex]|uniref:pentapeptide repeat-containing protein n=1 Tax=Baaleninema simplex TaxID=2862350 RepID=UPI00034A9712